MKIFLVREHIAVGEELIRVAYTNRKRAYDDAGARCHKTKTQNFDVIEVEEGEERTDI